ncbi:MAG: SusE domain-containing protein [Chitinophagaceae bacterium]|nr:SusE domain-containing protein [Chitinophagaceae bacterium]
MKFLLKLSLFTVMIATVLAACNKVGSLPIYANGSAVTMQLSASAITPTIADTSKNVLTFNWSNPKYATDSNTVKYILEVDSTGRNLSKAVSYTITGSLLKNFTGREVNNLLIGFGFPLGAAGKLDARITSSYGNNNEQYKSGIVTVLVTPFKDSSNLVTEKTSVVCALATSTQISNTFSWSPSFKGFSGTATYTLEYDSAGKKFVAPQSMPVGVSILSKAMTQADMNTTALNSGIVASTIGKVEYRIKAVTSTGSTVYSNTVNVTIQSYVPILRFYIPGGYQAATNNGNNWDPGTAPEMIRDLRAPVNNKMYYMYMYLPAGQEFKFTQGRSWDINFGGSNGVLSPGGSNLSVPTSGWYRITIDIDKLVYDIREGRMGFVGGATGAGWTPPNVFPNYALSNIATNLFIGLTDLGTGGWKMIDNNSWNNGSNTVDETRSYGTPLGDGGTLEVNGANFADNTTAGRYRAIWDGRDVNNVKYLFSPANEMRVVGDGINQPGVGSWDPATSPQMTYAGNGVWTITITLYANKDIKFLAGNAWGALDYEDNSGQSQATGVAKSIKWDGTNNFKTPTAAGTYIITLDEGKQTVTIN